MNWHDPAWVGAVGQWVGAIASFAAAFVALWIALDTKRTERKREERENRPHLVITELKWSVDDTITVKFFNAGRVPCTLDRIGFTFFFEKGSPLKDKNAILSLPEMIFPGGSLFKVFKFYECVVTYGESHFVKNSGLPHDSKEVYFTYGPHYPLSEYIAEYGFLNGTQVYLIGDREIPGRKKILRKHFYKKRSKLTLFLGKYVRKCGQMLSLWWQKRKGKKKSFGDTFDDTIREGYFFLMYFPFKTVPPIVLDSAMGDLIKIDPEQVEKMKGIPEIEFTSEFIIKFPLKLKIKDTTILFSNGKSLVFENNELRVV